MCHTTRQEPSSRSWLHLTAKAAKGQFLRLFRERQIISFFELHYRDIKIAGFEIINCESSHNTVAVISSMLVNDHPCSFCYHLHENLFLYFSMLFQTNIVISLFVTSGRKNRFYGFATVRSKSFGCIIFGIGS